ncbi:unnamed protein product [Leptidea sinapis]|uniref:Uncharacterized protein n=1 Tax=Leptidea sinapis TaxID=189913 RepID=A0A5E4QAU5_9NEOP|nr:unnamed protein product [Leptidea sinapis]
MRTDADTVYLNETVVANNLLSVMIPERGDEDMLKPLLRVKKQDEGDSGTGKYTAAAKMPQIKVLRLFLQLFKNAWDTSYVGGSHPLHHNVPKAVISLYKLRILDFFFPPIGEDPRKSG